MSGAKLVKPEREALPTGSGTTNVYTVEARYNYHEPTTLCGQQFDNRWREVQFERSTIGVPSNTFPLDLSGFYSFNAAQALRYWFLAQATMSAGAFCIETRLVRHKAKYSYEVKAEAYVDPFDFRGDVPVDMIAPEEQAQ